MVRGIGVDMTDINTIKRLMQLKDNAFVCKTFTDREREDARHAADEAEYLAVRFAIKEAVFKATAHLTSAKTYDFRIVESANRADGSPYVAVTEHLKQILEEAGVSQLLVSATTESNFATAFVVAV